MVNPVFDIHLFMRRLLQTPAQKVPDTNGTVTFFSLLAPNVTTRTVDCITLIKR